MVVPFACHLVATLLASSAVWFVILSNEGKAMGKSNGLHEATFSNLGGWLAVHKRVSKLVISICMPLHSVIGCQFTFLHESSL